MNFRLIFARSSSLSVMFTSYHTCLLMKYLILVYVDFIIIQMNVQCDKGSLYSKPFQLFFHSAFKDFWIELILWTILRGQNKDLISWNYDICRLPLSLLDLFLFLFFIIQFLSFLLFLVNCMIIFDSKTISLNNFSWEIHLYLKGNFQNFFLNQKLFFFRFWSLMFLIKEKV